MAGLGPVDDGQNPEPEGSHAVGDAPQDLIGMGDRARRDHGLAHPLSPVGPGRQHSGPRNATDKAPAFVEDRVQGHGAGRPFEPTEERPRRRRGRDWPTIEPKAPPVKMIGPSAPKGPPVPMLIAEEIGFKMARRGWTFEPARQVEAVGQLHLTKMLS